MAGHVPVTCATTDDGLQELPLRRPAEGGPSTVGCQTAVGPIDSIRGGVEGVGFSDLGACCA